ncbi:conserved membrane hypothetical protein [Frankia sp. AiPs1]|uniref:DUF4386 domain-containing protein n=1 Tax=Frankia sp. AiPa1 TaxID=573492 RepID=UPI00202AFBAD|nr:DUF4386 domain-containing protein [Frankia sp. AiPa1]MCL9761450.1 DUF4386 domain-containing protein [Frankia sp. AiPa1]
MFTGQRTTATLLLVSAVCGAVGLTMLRRAAGYPEVLTASGTASLAALQGHWFAVVTGLVLSVVAAALLVPITAGIMQLLPGGPHRPLPIVLATAASAAHLVGLLFWLFVVPALFRRAAAPNPSDQTSLVFDAARTLFGIMIGEVLACLLTACWSVCLVAGVVRARLPLLAAADSRRPQAALAGLGIWAAVASLGMLGGALLPFGFAAAVTGRVIGQFLWNLWLVGLAVAVWHLAPGRQQPDLGGWSGSRPPPTRAASDPQPPIPGGLVGTGVYADPRGLALDRSDSQPVPDGPDNARVAALPAAQVATLMTAQATRAPGAMAPPAGPAAVLDDAVFEAVTQIDRPGAAEHSRPAAPVRAAPQPAGRAIGNDDPTEPGIDTLSRRDDSRGDAAAAS